MEALVDERTRIGTNCRGPVVHTKNVLLYRRRNVCSGISDRRGLGSGSGDSAPDRCTVGRKNGAGAARVVRLELPTLEEFVLKSVFSTDVPSEATPDEPLHPLITDLRESRNGYYVVSRHYPEAGHVEICGLKLMSGEQLRKGGGAKRKNTDRSSMDDLTLQKSRNRSKTVARRKAMALCTDRILTLTFRENVTDIDAAWYVFKIFNRSMRETFGEGYRYVAVPEYQKRGAVHFHLAISGHYPVRKVRKLWLKAAGDKKGNIDITDPRKFGKNSWNPRRCANYISKYITKSDVTDFNKKRYSSGGNIPMPEPQKGWLVYGAPIAHVFAQVIQEFTDNPVQCMWQSDDNGGIVFFST